MYIYELFKRHQINNDSRNFLNTQKIAHYYFGGWCYTQFCSLSSNFWQKDIFKRWPSIPINYHYISRTEYWLQTRLVCVHHTVFTSWADTKEIACALENSPCHRARQIHICHNWVGQNSALLINKKLHWQSSNTWYRASHESQLITVF